MSLDWFDVMRLVNDKMSEWVFDKNKEMKIWEIGIIKRWENGAGPGVNKISLHWQDDPIGIEGDVTSNFQSAPPKNVDPIPTPDHISRLDDDLKVPSQLYSINKIDWSWKIFLTAIGAFYLRIWSENSNVRMIDLLVNVLIRTLAPTPIETGAFYSRIRYLTDSTSLLRPLRKRVYWPPFPILS